MFLKCKYFLYYEFNQKLFARISLSRDEVYDDRIVYMQSKNAVCKERLAQDPEN